MDGISKLTQNAIATIDKAKEVARELNNDLLKIEHLFIGLIQVDRGVASRTLLDFGIDFDKTVESIKDQLRIDTKYENKYILNVSDEFKTAIQNAFRIAMEMDHVYVGTEHILLGILQLSDLEFVKKLGEFKIGYLSAKDRVLKVAQYPSILQGDDKKNPDIKNFVKDKAKGSILESIARDLTEMAEKKQLDPVIGRHKEIERIISILARRTKNNPILIGDAGVGKTAIVEGLAQMIEAGVAPRVIADFRIWSIDTAAIVAGSQMRGDIEGKVLAIMEEVEERGNVILFIDEVHTILGAGSGGQNSLDIANILKPMLAKGKLRLIGATTQSEYNKHFENDPALSRRFQPILVEEVSSDDALKILEQVSVILETHHGVKIPDETIEQAVKLSERYISDRFLPDKAIDLIDEASAKKRLNEIPVPVEYKEIDEEITGIVMAKEMAVQQNNYEEAIQYRTRENKLKDKLKKIEKDYVSTISKKKNVVSVEDIKNVISQWTGIPVNSLSSTDIKTLKNLDKNLKSLIVGQSNAINSVSNAIKRARTGIVNHNRPLTSLLFLGPTGVGKTELAKSLASSLFGDREALIQVDMSEMMESHSVSKLIGAPPGYVGFDYGGQLTEKVRKKPFSVVLFDEIEKAHEDILNVLLQVLEDGRLTDGRGRTVSFRNTVIIMTSNIGASEIGKDDSLGFQLHNVNDVDEGKLDLAFDQMKERIMDELKNELAPEFINRIDEIVIFKSLTQSDVRKIVDIQLEDLEKRVNEKNLSINVSQKLRSKIAKDGYSDEYGARPVRRKVQELVESAISDYLLANRNIKFHRMLDVDLIKDKVEIIEEKIQA